MADPLEVTTEAAQAKARRARETFVAMGGTLPERASSDSPISCSDFYSAASTAYWFAAEAALTGAGIEYEAYYSGLGQAFEAAGDACSA